ncbi:MAG: SDR family oxidoreductase [Planctomycetales bacterium]|nr:SDR family oxidoreductase [Planctomycetales bacterium]
MTELWLQGVGALVTGASQRIGRCLARRLGALGARVAVHCHHSVEAAGQTAADIEAAGGQAAVVVADIAKGAAACRQLVADAAQAVGPLQILINNAATFASSSLEQLDEQEWSSTMALNLQGPAFLCQAVARQLRAAADGERQGSPSCSRRGHFIQIADWRATHPVPGHLAYTLSKAGLVAMTRLLAQELAPEIQVNAIAPGAILPPPGADDSHLDALRHRIPLRHTGRPADIADAMEYLLRSSFVTGEVLHVTGGQQLLG